MSEIIRDREHWQALAERDLPDAGSFVLRNAAITRRYARWYKEHGAIFKWAGAAAFASHRVGLALRPGEFMVRHRRVQRVAPNRKPPESAQIAHADIEILRDTNNRIYADSAWAHLAFIDPRGGIEAVLAGVAGRPQLRRLGVAFERIERGRHGGDAGAEEVWSGNLLLLEHEQKVNVQPAFARLSPGAYAFFSLFTSLDFDGDHWRIDWSTNTWFYSYMWTRGLPLLIRQGSLPDITNAEQRWHWASNAVFALWRTVDRDHPERIDLLLASERA